MTRAVLDEAHIHPDIRQKVSDHQRSMVDEVQKAVAANAVVVIGMAQNPYPKKACKALDAAGIAYTYLGYGSYFSQWRRRNALKMWTGWPTFPMVFVKRTLIGGANDLQRLLASGDIQRMLT